LFKLVVKSTLLPIPKGILFNPMSGSAGKNVELLELRFGDD